MKRTIPIRGVIGHDVTLDSVKAKLSGVTSDDELVFDISSPGGSVLVGFEIYNEIKNLPSKNIVFEINGLAASIASIIVMAGAEIRASEFSLFMIHNASTGVEGNAEELKQQIEILKKIDELLLDTYYNRNQERGKTKLTRDRISEMMNTETWLTPAEGVEYGFIDKIINKSADIAKVAAQYKPSMKHLQKLKQMLAMGGKLAITKEDVSRAFSNALEGRKYSNLTEEEINSVLVAVKSALEQQTGGDMTEEQTQEVDNLLNEVANEVTRAEAESSTEGQLSALRKSVAELTKTIETVAQSLVESGNQMEALTFEINNLKKQTRTFANRPFVNEASKLSIGGAYVDPYAKHRAQMADIDKKTRTK
jgi:ATP-dependent protease ClpP protease subunit